MHRELAILSLRPPRFNNITPIIVKYYSGLVLGSLANDGVLFQVVAGFWLCIWFGGFVHFTSKSLLVELVRYIILDIHVNEIFVRT